VSHTLTDQKQALLEYIDTHQDEAVAFFQDLVRTVSANPPGDERAVADKCAAFGTALGMSVEQFEPEPRRVSNLMRLRGSAGDPVLLFTSHLDTFPPGDETKWKYPPFGAEIHDGIVWGVGTRNMKAGLASAMFAAKAVVDCGIPLRGDLLLAQTADELQLGHKGLRKLVEQDRIHADFGVYTEANPPLKVEIAARGLVHVDITVHGFAKHTKYKVEPSTSGKPINAIVKMAKIIPAIEDMDFTNWSPHDHIPGPPVISVNQISGGFHPSQMADRCWVRCDCRTLPGQTTEDVIADVRRVIDRLMAEDPELKVDVEVANEAQSVAVSPDEPIVQAVLGAVHEVTGKDIPIGGVGSTTDMRWIVNNAGIPMCKFMFPTTESGTNEHESIQDYLDTIRVYSVLILNQLG
jgi:succinyl-diaminopimelate desuccinylase